MGKVGVQQAVKRGSVKPRINTGLILLTQRHLEVGRPTRLAAWRAGLKDSG